MGGGSGSGIIENKKESGLIQALDLLFNPIGCLKYAIKTNEELKLCSDRETENLKMAVTIDAAKCLFYGLTTIACAYGIYTAVAN